MRNSNRIRIFTTGGTIDKIYFDNKSKYEVGDPQVIKILEAANINLDYKVQCIIKKDSLDFEYKDYKLIKSKVKKAKEKKIIITHGTDSIIDTAKELYTISNKTIVLTGSIKPALFIDSDAIFNIGCAIIAVQTLKEGIYIIINGCIFDPYFVQKNYKLSRFEERK